MTFDFLFLPLKEKRCIFYIDFWLLVSFRTSNLPSRASCLRRRRESSSTASVRPMGWFRALPFKQEKKKLTQGQTAPNPNPTRRDGMSVFPQLQPDTRPRGGSKYQDAASPVAAAFTYPTCSSSAHVLSVFIGVFTYLSLQCSSRRCHGALQGAKKREWSS